MKNEMLYIYEVYKERSFSQAAKNLFLSQPALSSTIRKIEQELGLQIFDRNTLPIRLTEAGRLYIEAIEKIMAIERELGNDLSDLANLKAGRLVAAGANFFSACMLPPVIHTFVNSYPGIELELVEADSTVLYEEALRDRVDLILDAGVFDTARFVADTLFTETVLLGVPRENPLNERYRTAALTRRDILEGRHLGGGISFVPLADFSAERFILLKRGHDMHERSLGICENTGFRPETTIYLNQLSTVSNMSEHGLGCCFLTDTLIRLLQHGDPAMLYYRMDDPQAKRDVFIAHAAKKPVKRAMMAFIQIARAHYCTAELINRNI